MGRAALLTLFTLPYRVVILSRGVAFATQFDAKVGSWHHALVIYNSQTF